MVMTVTAMFCQKILDSVFFEPAFSHKMGILQGLAYKREEIGSEPVSYRKHETLFFAVQN
jgi:hypothetical protein